MNITTTLEDTRAIISLDGWLDTAAAPQLGEELDALPPEVSELELDLGKLEYITSAGLRQLVAAHKKLSGNLTLTNVSAEVRQVLHMAGFDKRLHIA